MIFKPIWLLRFLFPVLFIGLTAYDFFRFSQGNFQLVSLFDWSMFGLQLIVLYFMLLFLTIRYEISNGVLKIRSFLFRKESYAISDIILIEEDGMFSKFYKSNIGPDGAVLHIKGGKKVTIFCLSEHYKFMQLIKSHFGT